MRQKTVPTEEEWIAAVEELSRLLGSEVPDHKAARRAQRTINDFIAERERQVREARKSLQQGAKSR